MSAVDWLVVDTGLRPAHEHMALDMAFMAACGAGEIANCFRFLRFEPSALVGFHQSPEQELNLAYCMEHGIAVQRRLTGGGAIIFDPLQLGWELVCRRSALPAGDMSAMARIICEAAARGLSHLGIDAQFRPRNDIEVEGRKISGTGGIMDGEVVLFQGTVLMDLDIATMLRVLRVPVEKLDAHAIASVSERVTSLRHLLGEAPARAAVEGALLQGFTEHLGLCFARAPLPRAVAERLPAALAEVTAPEWLGMQGRGREWMPQKSAVLRAPGGTLRAEILLDQFGNRLRQVHFSGDYFVQPRRAVVDLEAALRNTHMDDLRAVVQAFFAGREWDGFGLLPENFADVVQRAAEAQS